MFPFHSSQLGLIPLIAPWLFAFHAPKKARKIIYYEARLAPSAQYHQQQINIIIAIFWLPKKAFLISSSSSRLIQTTEDTQWRQHLEKGQNIKQLMMTMPRCWGSGGSQLKGFGLRNAKGFLPSFDLRQLIAKNNYTKELGAMGRTKGRMVIGRCLYSFIYKTKSNEMRDLQHARFMSWDFEWLWPREKRTQESAQNQKFIKMLIAKNDLGHSISGSIEKWFQRTESNKNVGVEET